MQSSGKAGTPFVEFFVQTGITQYFIGPIRLDGEEKHALYVDYTLRDSTHSVSNVAMNFTLVAEALLQQPDSLVYYSAGKRLFSVEPPFEQFYVEKKKQVHQRYGSEMNYEQLRRLFASEDVLVHYYLGEKPLEFSLGRGSKKIFRPVNEKLIAQIELTK